MALFPSVYFGLERIYYSWQKDSPGLDVEDWEDVEVSPSSTGGSKGSFDSVFNLFTEFI